MQIIKFYWFDLDLDTMTLVLKHNLNIVKMYVYTENEAPTFNGSKLTAWTDTQTHKQTHRQMHRLDWNYYLSVYADSKYLSRGTNVK